LKDEEIYNIFDTERILGKKPLVAITNVSGLAGIAYWLNEYYELYGEKAVDKKSALVGKLKELVDAEYAQGRTTVMGDDELDNLVRQVSPKQHKLFSASESKFSES
jgi:isopropylmalate/homocitrate/citramalate synthase